MSGTFVSKNNLQNEHQAANQWLFYNDKERVTFLVSCIHSVLVDIFFFQ